MANIHHNHDSSFYFYHLNEPFGEFSNFYSTPMEYTNKDSYWDDGGDGTGDNRLGFTLMQVSDV